MDTRQFLFTLQKRVEWFLHFKYHEIDAHAVLMYFQPLFISPRYHVPVRHMIQYHNSEEEDLSDFRD